MRPGKTPRRTTRKSLQTFRVISWWSCVIPWPSYSTLAAGLILRTFVQYSVAFCSRLEAAKDVISGGFMKLIVSDKAAKFCVLRLELFLRKWTKSRWRRHFPFSIVFFATTADRKYLLTSYPVLLYTVGVDVRIKFDYSSLNSGRNIRLFTSGCVFTHFYAIFNCIFAADRNQIAMSYPIRH